MSFLINTSKVLLLLVLFSFQMTFILASKYKMFQYMFFLIYMGAMLVLIVYLFFSSSKVSFSWFSLKKMVLLGIFLSLIFFQSSFSQTMFSSEFEFSIYNENEGCYLIFLCLYMILVLFSILNLDLYRFSSLRSLF